MVASCRFRRPMTSPFRSASSKCCASTDLAGSHHSYSSDGSSTPACCSPSSIPPIPAKRPRIECDTVEEPPTAGLRCTGPAHLLGSVLRHHLSLRLRHPASALLIARRAQPVQAPTVTGAVSEQYVRVAALDWLSNVTLDGTIPVSRAQLRDDFRIGGDRFPL